MACSTVRLQMNKLQRIQTTDWSHGVLTMQEIILRPYQFCNLSEVVVREGDDY